MYMYMYIYIYIYISVRAVYSVVYSNPVCFLTFPVENILPNITSEISLKFDILTGYFVQGVPIYLIKLVDL